MLRSIRFAIFMLLPMLAACSHHEDAEVFMFKPRDMLQYEAVLVSHKGAWDGTGCAENSLDAIRCSREIGFRNVEIDLRITRDSVIVLSHEPKAGDKEISSNSLSSLNNLADKGFANMTKFEEVLKLMLYDRELMIIAEIKDVNIDILDRLVSKYGLKDRILFIAFDRKYTDQLIGMAYHCGYLGGDLDPKWLKDRGYEFMDYSYKILLEKSTWIVEAHRLGLIVGAFTVDDLETIKQLAVMGVDLITTNLTFQ